MAPSNATTVTVSAKLISLSRSFKDMLLSSKVIKDKHDTPEIMQELSQTDGNP